MRVYFAGRYSRYPEFRAYRDELVSLGHEVTSRWIDLHGATLPTSIPPDRLNAEPGACARYAVTDVEDVRRSDVVVSFTDERGGGKGGRHVEFGIALGLGKLLVIVGPRENVFHTLLGVAVFPAWPEFVSTLVRR